jgi:hypothetical protein
MPTVHVRVVGVTPVKANILLLIVANHGVIHVVSATLIVTPHTMLVFVIDLSIAKRLEDSRKVRFHLESRSFV